MKKVPSKGSKQDPFKGYLENRMKECTTYCRTDENGEWYRFMQEQSLTEGIELELKKMS